MREETAMEYVAERVINISELEALIGSAYDTITLVRKKLEIKKPADGPDRRACQTASPVLVESKGF